MSYPVIRANAPLLLLLLLLPTDKASMQELILQEHKQIFCKTCSCCKKNAWYVESKHILQPPKYLSIIVNRFSYINNKIIKNRSFIPLYKNIMPGPYKFNLWATVDHHGYSMNRGYYTASINCYGKPFIVTILKSLHDDAIKWKHFHVAGHLWGEITGPRWIPRTKASDAERWCWLWSASE